MDKLNYKQSVYELLEASEEKKHGETVVRIPGLYESYRKYRASVDINTLGKDSKKAFVQPPNSKGSHEPFSNVTTTQTKSSQYFEDIVGNALRHDPLYTSYRHPLSPPVPTDQGYLDYLRQREDQLSDQSAAIRGMIDNLDVLKSPRTVKNPIDLDYGSQMIILESLQEQLSSPKNVTLAERANKLKDLQLKQLEEQQLLSKETSDAVENMTYMAMRRARRSLGKETSVRYFMQKQGWICLRILYLQAQMSLKMKKNELKVELFLKKRAIDCFRDFAMSRLRLRVHRRLYKQQLVENGVKMMFEEKWMLWRRFVRCFMDKLSGKYHQLRNGVKGTMHFQQKQQYVALSRWYDLAIRQPDERLRGFCHFQIKAFHRMFHKLKSQVGRYHRYHKSKIHFRVVLLYKALLRWRAFRHRYRHRYQRNKQLQRSQYRLRLRKLFQRWKTLVTVHIHRLGKAIHKAKKLQRLIKCKHFWPRWTAITKHRTVQRRHKRFGSKAFLRRHFQHFLQNLKAYIRDGKTLATNYDALATTNNTNNNSNSNGNTVKKDDLPSMWKSRLIRRGMRYWEHRSMNLSFRHWRSVVRLHRHVRRYNRKRIRRTGQQVLDSWVQRTMISVDRKQRLRHALWEHHHRDKKQGLRAWIARTETIYQHHALVYKGRKHFHQSMAQMFVSQLKCIAQLQLQKKTKRSIAFSGWFFKWRYANPWRLFVQKVKQQRKLFALARRKSKVLRQRRYLRLWCHFLIVFPSLSAERVRHRQAKALRLYRECLERRGIDRWMQYVSQVWQSNRRFHGSVRFNVSSRKMLQRWITYLEHRVEEISFLKRFKHTSINYQAKRFVHFLQEQVHARRELASLFERFDRKVLVPLFQRRVIRTLQSHVARNVVSGEVHADAYYKKKYGRLVFKQWQAYREDLEGSRADIRYGESAYLRWLTRRTLRFWYRTHLLSKHLQQKKLTMAQQYFKYVKSPLYLAQWRNRLIPGTIKTIMTKGASVKKIAKCPTYAFMKASMVVAKRFLLKKYWKCLRVASKRNKQMVKTGKRALNLAHQHTKAMRLKIGLTAFHRNKLEMKKLKTIVNILNNNCSGVYLRLTFDAIRAYVQVGIIVVTSQLPPFSI